MSRACMAGQGAGRDRPFSGSLWRCVGVRLRCRRVTSPGVHPLLAGVEAGGAGLYQLRRDIPLLSYAYVVPAGISFSKMSWRSG